MLVVEEFLDPQDWRAESQQGLRCGRLGCKNPPVWKCPTSENWYCSEHQLLRSHLEKKKEELMDDLTKELKELLEDDILEKEGKPGVDKTTVLNQCWSPEFWDEDIMEDFFQEHKISKDTESAMIKSLLGLDDD